MMVSFVAKKLGLRISQFGEPNPSLLPPPWIIPWAIFIWPSFTYNKRCPLPAQSGEPCYLYASVSS